VEVLISISSSRREIAGAEIAIQRIAAETARIFSTFSLALHFWAGGIQWPDDVWRESNSEAERAKRQGAEMKAVIASKSQESLLDLQEPSNTDASC
jgi:hypothetical protein